MGNWSREQMLTCCRSDIIEVADDGRLALDERTRGLKTAALHIVSPTQERALGFALTFEYLADVERADQVALSAWKARPGEDPEPDYALFPGGHLAKGRAAVKAGESKPANDGKRMVDIVEYAHTTFGRIGVSLKPNAD